MSFPRAVRIMLIIDGEAGKYIARVVLWLKRYVSINHDKMQVSWLPDNKKMQGDFRPAIGLVSRLTQFVRQRDIGHDVLLASR